MGNRKHYSKSIMPTEYEVCYLCGELGRERHHCLHGTANRQIAEREGLWVWLCHECHRTGKQAVHRCKSTDIFLEQEAQSVWETKYIIKNDSTKEEARMAFMNLFGKSYIWEDE